MPSAIGAAMRPIDLQSVADRSAEELVDRDAQGLCLYIDKRVLDRRDRHLVEAARRLPRHRVQQGRNRLDRTRVAAYQEPVRELLDTAGQSLGAVPLHIFRPADD